MDKKAITTWLKGTLPAAAARIMEALSPTGSICDQLDVSKGAYFAWAGEGSLIRARVAKARRKPQGIIAISKTADQIEPGSCTLYINKSKRQVKSMTKKRNWGQMAHATEAAAAPLLGGGLGCLTLCCAGIIPVDLFLRQPLHHLLLCGGDGLADPNGSGTGMSAAVAVAIIVTAWPEDEEEADDDTVVALTSDRSPGRT